MAKTLITWPHGSTDGEREAKRLQALYASGSVAKDGADLGSVPSGEYPMIIIVGHRSEIKNNSYEILESLGKGLKALGARYVVLAACSSGTAKSSGETLGDNELWEPAQVVANFSGATVAATSRGLYFTEVGESGAFGPNSDFGIGIKEPDSTKQLNSEGSLWKYFTKKDEVDDLADALKRI
jgi:hypothetical protein